MTRKTPRPIQSTRLQTHRVKSSSSSPYTIPTANPIIRTVYTSQPCLSVVIIPACPFTLSLPGLLQFSSVQFSSRWYLCAREGLICAPPSLSRVSQCCPWNSLGVDVASLLRKSVVGASEFESEKTLQGSIPCMVPRYWPQYQKRTLKGPEKDLPIQAYTRTFSLLSFLLLSLYPTYWLSKLKWKYWSNSILVACISINWLYCGHTFTTKHSMVSLDCNMAVVSSA